MTEQKKSEKIHLGEGILKPGVRPVKILVDEQGEYWICDANVDPESADFSKESCTAYSKTHMAEGG